MNSHIRERQQPDWKPIPQPALGDSPVPPVPESSEAAVDYQRTRLELTALLSRLADEPTRAILYEAVSAVEAVRWTGYHSWTSIDDIKDAQMPAIVAIGNAIEKLGELLARPPVTPSSWWDRVRGRTPPSPPGVTLYKLMGPEDLEEISTEEKLQDLSCANERRRRP